MSLAKIHLEASRTTKAIKEDAPIEFGRKGGDICIPMADSC